MAEATLSPYNPTWRDRIASALAGDSRPGSARSNFAEGLMGSRGIGTTGMGLVDLTPAGIPMAGQEAKRDADAGNWMGATANAMALIPAAKPAKWFHGSPKPNLAELIASKEGGALGPGVYLTPSKNVASNYAGVQGHIYEAAPDMNVFNGIGKSMYDNPSAISPSKEWRDQIDTLSKALTPSETAKLGDYYKKLNDGDGYSLLREMAYKFGSKESAHDVFRRAGFTGISGHVDGPEVLMFNNVIPSQR